ncbi:hypothetical protein V2J09_020884 [Rumex salicifolius]
MVLPWKSQTTYKLMIGQSYRLVLLHGNAAYLTPNLNQLCVTTVLAATTNSEKSVLAATIAAPSSPRDGRRREVGDGLNDDKRRDFKLEHESTSAVAAEEWTLVIKLGVLL